MITDHLRFVAILSSTECTIVHLSIHQQKQKRLKWILTNEQSLMSYQKN